MNWKIHNKVFLNIHNHKVYFSKQNKKYNKNKIRTNNCKILVNTMNLKNKAFREIHKKVKIKVKNNKVDNNKINKEIIYINKKIIYINKVYCKTHTTL